MDKAMQYYSFPGGRVLSSQFLDHFGEEVGMNRHPLFPPTFSTTASMSFTFEEIYPWREDRHERVMPMEFIFNAASYRINQWGFKNLVEMYEQVASYIQRD